MATQREGEASQETTTNPLTSISELVQERYRKIKEHAETYPYVWASYTLVYGGLALWTIYRYRKLRKTEDRVRALQGRLRKLVENEESANSDLATARLGDQVFRYAIKSGHG
ncbi:proline-rich receptor-like protein kinase PERK2-like isoform X1 [Hibiscus syriacus]|uniref:Proline-rich receptor-like protein kinase PERK2-like isoform X1 n=1 Tax=Hibiscus syriacus TaxID=106335 RepID=A0A6A2Y6M5_HIBSY|nr:proline-rich receptor-like protein kinase PERK2-like isoform X1 [Hibiscus syriacus]